MSAVPAVERARRVGPRQRGPAGSSGGVAVDGPAGGVACAGRSVAPGAACASSARSSSPTRASSASITARCASSSSRVTRSKRSKAWATSALRLRSRSAAGLERSSSPMRCWMSASMEGRVASGRSMRPRLHPPRSRDSPGWPMRTAGTGLPHGIPEPPMRERPRPSTGEVTAAQGGRSANAPSLGADAPPWCENGGNPRPARLAGTWHGSCVRQSPPGTSRFPERMHGPLLEISMKRALLAAAVAGAVAAATAPAAPADDSPFSANGSIATQYQCRGLSVTTAEPALQGGLDYAHPGGFYAGPWAARISWLSDGPADVSSSAEWDFYGGYAGTVGEFGYDAGLLYYYYPGSYPS